MLYCIQENGVLRQIRKDTSILRTKLMYMGFSWLFLTVCSYCTCISWPTVFRVPRSWYVTKDSVLNLVLSYAHVGWSPQVIPGQLGIVKWVGEFLLGKGEFIKTKSPGSGACQHKLNLKWTLSNVPVIAKPLPPTHPKERYSTVQKSVDTRFSILARINNWKSSWESRLDSRLLRLDSWFSIPARLIKPERSLCL